MKIQKGQETMTNDRQTIEKRMANIRNIYLKIDQMIDTIPDEIPMQVRELLKDKILGDKDLKELMDGIDNHRPPRFLLVGRTGAGKSSLINAITGFYSAQVSDTESCTPGIEICKVYDEDNVLMELLDTRGIAESAPVKELATAEGQLLDQVNGFSPDAAIFLLNCAHRDSVGEDAEFCKLIVKAYEERNHVKLPVIVVMNKADEVQPGRIKDPKYYNSVKINNIEEIVRNYRNVLDKHELKYETAIAVSSYIEWMTKDGREVSAEEINSMTAGEKAQLLISFDGRYQISELIDILEEVIEDFQAKMGLRMALRLNDLVSRLSVTLTRIFAGISATVALTPIPVSDIYILCTLQAFLVTIIASLSGRDISLDTAKEFIVSILGVGGFGFLLRFGAQQVVKLFNLVVPAAGSAASAAIAAGGTITMGKLAKKYYIDGQSKEMARKMILKTKELKNGNWENLNTLKPSDIAEIDRQISEFFR